MIIRWNRPTEFDEMGRLMRRFLEDVPMPSEEKGRLTRPSWTPPVDAWETEEAFHILFDLPGVNKEDIEIEVEGDQLTVKGERKINQDIDYLRRERVFGPFYRAFTLETPIEKEKIKAIYKAGVLEIILPKKEEAKPKQIQIEVAEE